MPSLKCTIVSAERELYSGEVTSLTISGTEGEMGINHGHAPLITALIPSPVSLNTTDGQKLSFYISGGYMEVQENTVCILADTAYRAQELDESLIEQAIQEAELAMENKSSEFDFSQAQTHLIQAIAQLRSVRNLKR